MWNDKLKAVTFSFDDGILQDIRLVEILDKYGLKGTFNLNSGMMNGEVWQTRGVDVIRMTHQECLDTFKNHEVAVHTLTHPDLLELPRIMQQRQIAGDKANIEFMFKREITGMAYPGRSGTDEELIEVIKEAGIKYARLIDESLDFSMPEDLYKLKSTAHFMNKNILDYAEKFINLKPEEPALFYIFGHSYELDYEDRWVEFEKLCELISNKDDIFYGTNQECLEHLY